jgi:hypothetical protein
MGVSNERLTVEPHMREKDDERCQAMQVPNWANQLPIPDFIDQLPKSICL